MQNFFRLLTRLILLAVVASVLVAGLGYWQYMDKLKAVSGETDRREVRVTVPEGASTARIAADLEGQGLIKNALVFRAYSRIKGLDGNLKAGEFVLDTSMGVPEIMDKIAKGSVEYITFTIPEGFNTKQIADTLAQKGLVNRETFMDLAANGEFNYDFLAGLPNNEKRLEGYLFPDTYKITKKTTEKEIIDMMLAHFQQVTASDYEQKARKLGLSLHQAVTLASIIEREAKVDQERPKVASVFLNRLQKGWKLESCATVQYALGQQKARLLNKDLQIDSPYNTYKITGLPPGPIASPGKASLQAAVNPVDTKYLFFVVFENGEHVFSNTLAEHNKARAKYIKESFGN